MKHTKILTSSVVLFITATASGAQDIDFTKIGVESGVSTLGLYVAPDVAINDNVRVRAPLYFGDISRTVDVDDNDIDGSLEVTALHVMGDYYFGNSGFRASGGLAIGGYSFEGNTTNPTIDGVTYNAAFTGKLEQDKNVAPVFAVGYQRVFGNNWGFSAEVGARVTSVKLSTTGQETLSAADQASFQEDLDDINSDLSDVKAIPFLSLGVSYRF